MKVAEQLVAGDAEQEGAEAGVVPQRALALLAREECLLREVGGHRRRPELEEAQHARVIAPHERVAGTTIPGSPSREELVIGNVFHRWRGSLAWATVRRNATPVALLLAVLGGCVRLGAHRCDANQDCSRSGTQGTCQSDGYCSFPDDDCASGQAYGDLAPDDLAGTCVAGSGGGDSGPIASDGTDVTTTGPTDDATSDASSSGSACPPVPDPLPAFPGAQGFGTDTLGGRGGALCRVSTLDDAGDGSLRDCLERAGPRIVIFDVGGTIELETPISIRSPFVTVAGQSAPGGGIAVRSVDSSLGAVLSVVTHDVVLRHLRIRSGFVETWSLSIGSVSDPVHHVVLDHLSVSWASRPLFLVDNWADVTVQWCAVYEAFNGTNSGVAFAAQYGRPSPRLSLHHNLLAHSQSGMPLLTNGGPYHMINNWVRNWGPFGTRLTEVQVNLVGNVWERGNDSNSLRYAIGADAIAPESIFVRDNIAPYAVEGDDWSVVGVADNEGVTDWQTPAPAQWQAVSPWPPAPIEVETVPAADVVATISANAGATLPERDEADERIAVGGGMIVDTVPQWPSLAPGRPPLDSDGDGMPDAWEEAQGLNPTSAAAADLDSDGDGYPDLEEYLNATDPLSCHSPG